MLQSCVFFPVVKIAAVNDFIFPINLAAICVYSPQIGGMLTN